MTDVEAKELLQQFLSENGKLLEAGKYDELYSNLKYFNKNLVPRVTKALMQMGINPLEKMTTVPDFYATCLDITEIDIPKHITTIGSQAFSMCKKLKKVNAPSVKTIEDYAFEGCESLVDIVLPETPIILEQGVFCGCMSLENLKIVSHSNILRYTFLGCVSLKTLELVTDNGYSGYARELDDESLKFCKSLEYIDFGIHYFAASTLEYCKNLKKVKTNYFSSDEMYHRIEDAGLDPTKIGIVAVN